MIKSNEVRVGNWVVFDNDSFPEQMRLESFAILYKYPERITSIEPIPLTPEILEKIKFSGMIFPAQLSVSNTGKYYWGNGVDIEIKHLHQLQNLYFAITGEELEINLNP